MLTRLSRAAGRLGPGERLRPSAAAAAAWGRPQRSIIRAATAPTGSGCRERGERHGPSAQHPEAQPLASPTAWPPSPSHPLLSTPLPSPPSAYPGDAGPSPSSCSRMLHPVPTPWPCHCPVPGDSLGFLPHKVPQPGAVHGPASRRCLWWRGLQVLSPPLWAGVPGRTHTTRPPVLASASMRSWPRAGPVPQGPGMLRATRGEGLAC